MKEGGSCAVDLTLTSTPSSPEPEASKIRKESVESRGTPSLISPTTRTVSPLGLVVPLRRRKIQREESISAGLYTPGV